MSDEYVWKDELFSSGRAFKISCVFCRHGYYANEYACCRAGVFKDQPHLAISSMPVCSLFEWDPRPEPSGILSRSQCALHELCFDE